MKDRRPSVIIRRRGTDRGKPAALGLRSAAEERPRLHGAARVRLSTDIYKNTDAGLRHSSAPRVTRTHTSPMFKAKFHYDIMVADRCEAGRRPVSSLLAS